MYVRNLSHKRGTYSFMMMNTHFHVKCVINLSSSGMHWRSIYAHIVESLLSHMMCVRNLRMQQSTLKMHLNT